MTIMSTDIPEALDKKVQEYAVSHNLMRPSAKGQVPNKAEALRAILREFFQLQEM